MTLIHRAKPLGNITKITYLGTCTNSTATYDIKTHSKNYKNLTSENFLSDIVSYYANNSFTPGGNIPPTGTLSVSATKSYNAATGILTVTIPTARKAGSSTGSGTAYQNVGGSAKIYLIE